MPDYDFDFFEHLLDSLTEAANEAANDDIDVLSTTLSDLMDAVEAVEAVEAQMFQAVIDGRVRTLLYTDEQGVQSVRHVTVNSIWRCKNDKAVASTYDLDRQASRSYRLDRIDKALDGHVLLDEAWFA